jgi:hypothetical protein
VRHTDNHNRWSCVPLNSSCLSHSLPTLSAVGAGVSQTHRPAIDGLHLLTDFITGEEEARLMAAIESGPWETGGIARRVQHYGTKFDYRTLTSPAVAADTAGFITAGCGVPASDSLLPSLGAASVGCEGLACRGEATAIDGAIAAVADKVARLPCAVSAVDGRYQYIDSTEVPHDSIPRPNQVTVNEYIPGAVPGSDDTPCVCRNRDCLHRCSPQVKGSRRMWTPTLRLAISFSPSAWLQVCAAVVDGTLGLPHCFPRVADTSDIVMDLRHDHVKDSIVLPRRSLLILSGMLPRRPRAFVYCSLR